MTGDTYLNIFTTKNRLADENLSGINNTNNCFYLQKPETVCLIAKVKICSLNNKMYECMIKKTFVVSRFPFRFIYRRFIIGIAVRDVRERQKTKKCTSVHHLPIVVRTVEAKKTDCVYVQ